MCCALFFLLCVLQHPTCGLKKLNQLFHNAYAVFRRQHAVSCELYSYRFLVFFAAVFCCGHDLPLACTSFLRRQSLGKAHVAESDFR